MAIVATQLVFRRPYEVSFEQEHLKPEMEDEVLVQSEVSAVSCGTELLVYKGLIAKNTPLDDSIEALKKPFAYPLRYGYSTVGTIIDQASSIKENLIGQRVFGFLPHATHHLCKKSEVFPIPQSMHAKSASLIANMETAIGIVMDAQPTIGENVALFGLGNVGLLTALLLSPYPLGGLILIDPDTKRLSTCQKLIEANSNNAPVSYYPSIEEAKEDADLMIELSGHPEALEDAMKEAPLDGRIIVGSWYGSKTYPNLLRDDFHRKRLKLISSQVSHIRADLRPRFSKMRRLMFAADTLSKLDLSHLKSLEMPFSKAVDAFELLDKGLGQYQNILFYYP